MTRLLATTVFLMLPFAASAAPDTLAYGGRLLDSTGQPLNTTAAVRVELHSDPVAEAFEWGEDQGTITLVDGYFHVELGDTSPIQTVLRTTPGTLWVQVEIDEQPMGARTALNAAPYAVGTPGGLVSMQSFTSSGTWTRPDGVGRIEVTVTGGGGGGGSHNTDDAQGGGGAGGTAIEIIDVSNITSVPVTIGSGGAGGCGNSNTAGDDGGTTSFGSFLSATGGMAPATWGIGGVGGMGQGGDLNLRGNDGGAGNIDGQGNEEAGGSGGASYWGGSASGGTYWAVRRDGVNGSGGGGAHAHSSNCGGSGGDGIVVVRHYAR